MDEKDNTAEINEGLNRRATFTNNGAQVGLVEYPFVRSLILTSCCLDVRKSKSNDAFVLMAGETPNNCKLKIMSSTLRRRKVRVADSVKLERVQTTQGHKGNALLPAIKTLIRTLTQATIIPQGVLRQTYSTVSFPSASFLGSCEMMPSTGILQEILSTFS